MLKAFIQALVSVALVCVCFGQPRPAIATEQTSLAQLGPGEKPVASPSTQRQSTHAAPADKNAQRKVQCLCGVSVEWVDTWPVRTTCEYSYCACPGRDCTGATKIRR